MQNNSKYKYSSEFEQTWNQDQIYIIKINCKNVF